MSSFKKTFGLVLALAVLIPIATNAWSEPAAPAPTGNVAAPINVGNFNQTKGGSITAKGFSATGSILVNGAVQVGGAYTAPAVGDVKGTRLCIGSDCKSAWPGGIAGTNSGEANYIAKWTGANTLDNSALIFDNGVSVGIGTATPAATSKLEVNGTLKTSALVSTGSVTATSTIQAGTVDNNLVAGDVKGKRLCIGADCRSAWGDGGGSCGLSERELTDYGCPSKSYLNAVRSVCGEGDCGNGYESAKCRYFDPSVPSRTACYGSGGGASPLCVGKAVGTTVYSDYGACSASSGYTSCSCSTNTGTKTRTVYTCNADGSTTQVKTESVSCSVTACDPMLTRCDSCLGHGGHPCR